MSKRNGQLNSKALVIGLITVLVLVSTGLALSRINWTPKEETLAVVEQSFQEELKAQEEKQPEEDLSEAELTKDASQEGLENQEVGNSEEAKVSKEVIDTKSNDSLETTETANEGTSTGESDPSTTVTNVTESSGRQASSEVDSQNLSKTEVEVTTAVQETSTVDSKLKETSTEDVIVTEEVNVAATSTTATAATTSAGESKETQESTPKDQTDSLSGQVVKDSWVQDMIDENRGVISDEDLLVGSAIYNKLDTIYILDLSDEGFTDEEEAELKIYLEDNLTASEIDIMWKLFDKYVYLVN